MVLGPWGACTCREGGLPNVHLAWSRGRAAGLILLVLAGPAGAVIWARNPGLLSLTAWQGRGG